MEEVAKASLVALTANIISAYVSNNSVGREDIALIEIRRELLPDGELFLEPIVTRLIPVQRIAP